MATINNMLSTGMSDGGLFSNNGSFNLADWNSIKNGSYGKLMKAYYSDNGNDAVKSIAKTKAEIKEVTKKLDKTESTASALSDATKKIMDSKLWAKKDITEKDEKTGEKVTKNDYDRDAIYKALKSFADAYNDTLDDTAESTNTSILRQASFMTKITSSSAKALGYAGITIGADNKLSVDEDFVKSDMDVEAAKRAFSGNNSFGSQIALKSTTIKNQANSAANNYTKNGGYASSDYSSYNAWM